MNRTKAAIAHLEQARAERPRHGAIVGDKEQAQAELLSQAGQELDQAKLANQKRKRATSESTAGYTVNMTGERVVVESMDQRMARIMRDKTPAERLEIAFDMWRSVRQMTKTILESQHPDWPPSRVEREVARRMSHGAC